MQTAERAESRGTCTRDSESEGLPPPRACFLVLLARVLCYPAASPFSAFPLSLQPSPLQIEVATLGAIAFSSSTKSVAVHACCYFGPLMCTWEARLPEALLHFPFSSRVALSPAIHRNAIYIARHLHSLYRIKSLIL